MPFSDGALYTVRELPRTDPDWKGIEAAVHRRKKPDARAITLETIYSVQWKMKPFPWSWTREFKPNRRFFYHGTSINVIRRILDEGFKVGDATAATHGRMLGNGVYATYHTNKGGAYAPEGYVVSVMVYAPNTLCLNPDDSIDASSLATAMSRYDAIEVRTAATVMGWKMLNHEICVFDTRRVIPRFILRIT